MVELDLASVFPSLSVLSDAWHLSSSAGPRLHQGVSVPLLFHLFINSTALAAGRVISKKSPIPILCNGEPPFPITTTGLFDTQGYDYCPLNCMTLRHSQVALDVQLFHPNSPRLWLLWPPSLHHHLLTVLSMHHTCKSTIHQIISRTYSLTIKSVTLSVSLCSFNC
ncbi:hypothetical protein BU24DRAFT_171196 [Aaosphaeria arxii CBS 175.79]|uniref:Uncharacterized protein n=1 Tax=Aaosphaeria arxii CBS 175.79 TaxID=1450172 RepID=A0A6A5Y0J9_9PLEO|nr:uncharacterized protein BU24DRAFT_171196 [Aaosphaeria arxii CBS 175.79]KAF2018451.1 hypothetical protein BU24DRAFT_171196 [Aaosphaeria arxii CBS 175.79]